MQNHYTMIYKTFYFILPSSLMLYLKVALTV